MQHHFLALEQFTGKQLQSLVDRTLQEKPLYLAGEGPRTLEGKSLAMLFEKASLRTRVSFQVAMTQLGGTGIYLDQAGVGIDVREPAKDIARVLAHMCDGIMARTFSHHAVEQLAAYSSVPVVNGLTDHCHPCQAMADLTTVQEHFGDLAGRTLAFIGDGNNVARSLMVACAKLGVHFVLACPEGYELEEEFWTRIASSNPQTTCWVTHDPIHAVAQADVVYTDTWTSMGQEEEKQKRLADFSAFQVNEALLSAAPDHAIVLHCLPAYRGSEISEGVMETHADVIFTEADNRLHFQRTLLSALMADGGIE